MPKPSPNSKSKEFPNFNALDVSRVPEKAGCQVLTPALPDHMDRLSYPANADDWKPGRPDKKETMRDNNQGQTVLPRAPSNAILEVAKWLNNHNITDINATDNCGRTALHLAAMEGNKDIVKALLHMDAEVNAKIQSMGSQNGWTALHLAAEKGHTGVVELLLAGDAQVDAKIQSMADRHYMWTALHLAAEKGHTGVVELLLAGDAQVDAKIQSMADQHYMWTALHLAAEKGHKGVVELLLGRQAQVDAKIQSMASPYYGWTASQLAKKGGHKDVVELLLCADLDARTRRDRQTALHYAARERAQN